jgi:hypothetical protein
MYFIKCAACIKNKLGLPDGGLTAFREHLEMWVVEEMAIHATMIAECGIR